MKRFHVHLSVRDLEQSINFYSALFGMAPHAREQDYAKWMLEDPRMNFAISRTGIEPGIDHLGFQVDTETELGALTGALKDAGLAVLDEGEATCCYARSDKGWVRDPQGVAWEAFFTRGKATVYGGGRSSGATASCCAPAGERGGVALSADSD